MNCLRELVCVFVSNKHCRTKKIFDNKNSMDVFINILDSIHDSTYELEGKFTENVQTEAQRKKQAKKRLKQTRASGQKTCPIQNLIVRRRRENELVRNNI